MSFSLSELTETWLPWLNQVLSDHSFPLRASLIPDDGDDDDEDDSIPIVVHVHSLKPSQPPCSIPAMIGLVVDNNSPLDEEDGNTNAMLSDQIFLKQIARLCSAVPMRCFIARGDGRISFYSVSDAGAGRDGALTKLDVVEHGSHVRSEDGRPGWSEQMLVDCVKRNLAQVVSIAPAFYQQAFLS